MGEGRKPSSELCRVVDAFVQARREYLALSGAEPSKICWRVHHRLQQEQQRLRDQLEQVASRVWRRFFRRSQNVQGHGPDDVAQEVWWAYLLDEKLLDKEPCHLARSMKRAVKNRIIDRRRRQRARREVDAPDPRLDLGDGSERPFEEAMPSETETPQEELERQELAAALDLDKAHRDIAALETPKSGSKQAARRKRLALMRSAFELHMLEELSVPEIVARAPPGSVYAPRSSSDPDEHKRARWRLSKDLGWYQTMLRRVLTDGHSALAHRLQIHQRGMSRSASESGPDEGPQDAEVLPAALEHAHRLMVEHFPRLKQAEQWRQLFLARHMHGRSADEVLDDERIFPGAQAGSRKLRRNRLHKHVTRYAKKLREVERRIGHELEGEQRAALRRFLEGVGR